MVLGLTRDGRCTIGLNNFAHFMVVTAQVMSLVRSVTPFTQL